MSHLRLVTETWRAGMIGFLVAKQQWFSFFQNRNRVQTGRAIFHQSRSTLAPSSGLPTSPTNLKMGTCSNGKAAGSTIPLNIKFNAYRISDAAVPKLERFTSSSWKYALSAALALENSWQRGRIRMETLDVEETPLLKGKESEAPGKL